MSLKIKISIIAICFALVAAVCIGFVFAAPNETITMNGNVSYEVVKATLTVSPNDPDLGSTTGSGSETGSGEYVIGETVTLTATTKSGSTFRAWATSTDPNTMEIVSASATYSFELTEDSPTTYFALFNKATSYNQTVEDLKYIFYNDAKLAEVTDATSTSLSGALEIPSVVESEGNFYKVYSIYNYAFENCSSLTSIQIPEGVTEIGYQAFYSCSSLEAFYGDGNEYYTIDDNRALLVDGGKTLLAYARANTERSYTIPEGVTSIGSSAFRYCSSLTSITIPEGVTSIGSSAFSGCSSLTTISIPEGVTSIGSSAFDSCSSLTSITIPGGVTSIGSSTFQNCYNLTAITLPSTLTSIGNSAFRGCSSLTSITLPPSTLTSIGEYAFRDCSSLTSISIPEGVTEIGTQTFYNCSSLTTISIPEGVTSIGRSAFDGCSSLTSITLPPSTLTSIGSSAFRYCSNLTSISIPEGVTSIGSNAFNGCYALAIVYNNSSLNITAGSTGNGYVGYYAKEIVASGEEAVGKIETEGNVRYYVNGATIIALVPSVPRDSLTSVTIREGTTEINQRAFDDCSNLTSISIPEGVTKIGSYAFNGCCALAIVYNNSNLSITAGSYDNGYVGLYAKEIVSSGEKAVGEIVVEGNVQYYVNGATIVALAPSVARDSLTSVTIREGTTEINQKAFGDCSNLTSITIPEGVTSIGDSAFSGCSKLTSITIPKGVTEIGSSAFSGCSSLTTITIPEGVTSIGGYAFQSCSSLTSITINGNISSLGINAFKGCSKLTSLTLGEGVISLPNLLFTNANLTSLTEIVVLGNLNSSNFPSGTWEKAGQIVTNFSGAGTYIKQL